MQMLHSLGKKDHTHVVNLDKKILQKRIGLSDQIFLKCPQYHVHIKHSVE